jgi:hypothetical protein
MIEADFTFHPIGQGCFYSGNIKVNDTNLFRFVYDCGSITKGGHLEKAISAYKSSFSTGDKLDLLIISHFDQDHVNGVDKLLNGIRCDKIIIPYYDKIERLLLYAVSDRTDDLYRQFLADPIGYFDERYDIGEIIVVGEPDEGSETIENLVPITPRNKLSLENLKKIIDELKDINLKGTSIVEYPMIYGTTKAKKLKVSHLTEPYTLDIAFWEFVFHLKKIDDPNLVKKFRDDVNTILETDNIAIKDLFDKDSTNSLRKYYKELAGDVNSTSLVTYHGPLFEVDKIKYIKNCEMIKYGGSLRSDFSLDKKFGTLLTGDINISSKRSHENIIKHLGSEYFDQIRLFQVPHHGSKYCWPFQTKEFHKFPTYVVNHGFYRKKHPAKKVLDHIHTIIDPALQSFYVNNEYAEFQILFKFPIE